MAQGAAPCFDFRKLCYHKSRQSSKEEVLLRIAISMSGTYRLAGGSEAGHPSWRRP